MILIRSCVLKTFLAKRKELVELAKQNGVVRYELTPFVVENDELIRGHAMLYNHEPVSWQTF